MIDSSQLYKPLAMTVIWTIIYSSDWLMDWWGALLYHKHVKNVCFFEKGYNIKSISEKELKHPPLLLTRYISELLITASSVWLVLYTCRIFSGWTFYEFFCGIFIILEGCIHFRHIRNVAVFSLIMKKKHGVKGKIEVPKWISLRFAFTEFSVFSLILLTVYMFDSRNFFVLGGMFACAIAAFYHVLMANLEDSLFKKTLFK